MTMNDSAPDSGVRTASTLARRVWLRGAAASALAMTGLLSAGCAQHPPRTSGTRTELRAYLRGATEVAPGSGAANGVCEATYDSATRVLDWHVKWARLKGTSPELNFFEPIAVARTDQGLAGTLSLTQAAADDFAAGRVHVNVMTSKFPTGEVRGRIHRDASQPTPDRLAMTAILTGGKEPAPNDSVGRGRLTGTFNPAARQFDWHLQQTSLTGMPIAIMLESELPHYAFIGNNGMQGAVTLTEGQAADLLAGRWMVTVETTLYPLGEIRGQLVPQK